MPFHPARRAATDIVNGNEAQCECDLCTGKEVMSNMAEVGDVIEQDGKQVKVTAVDADGKVTETEPVEQTPQAP